MNSDATGTFKPRLWVTGDWNAFFGLFTNVLLNVIVLTTLCLYVIKMPGDIVFGRILPALGIALPIGNLYYAYLAYRLATREGRHDVAAMPYGPSVPHMFIVVFVIMLPVLGKTGSVAAAWQAGLAWAFIIGIVVLAGAFVGPTIRKYTPRAAMLGTLAGISITFISMRPAFQMWEVPWIALVALAIILTSWTANVRLPFGIPGGLAAIVVGTVFAWIATALNWTGIMQPTAVGEAFGQFGLYLPWPSKDVLTGLTDVLPLLATAIPLGIYNFTEGMNNVESAAAAGDSYSLRSILLADGIGAVVGSFLGSPFPPAVYIGHPGWKAVGGRIGYSLATGVVIALVLFLGMTALFLAVIPLVAILPILLFIGLVIGAQAFQASPKRHAPAVVLALVPNIAIWGKTQVDNALGAAGTSAAQVGYDKLANTVVYGGMERVAGGAVLAGLMLGAIAAFIIDRKFRWAAGYAAVAAVLAYFGFIHAEVLEFGAQPTVALGYLMLAAVCLLVGLTHQEEPGAAQMRTADGALTVDTQAAGPGQRLDSGHSFELFVNGTLMRGQKLHTNLNGAEFLGEARTAPRYRLYSIDDVHPGMFEVDSGGVGVTGEVYRVSEDVWGQVEAGEPPELYRGRVRLEDGREIWGILYPRALAEAGHRDISEYADWRAYLDARADDSGGA
jgi:AGZA family xanthine/uracil permease-like MFS transporter